MVHIKHRDRYLILGEIRLDTLYEEEQTENVFKIDKYLSLEIYISNKYRYDMLKDFQIKSVPHTKNSWIYFFHVFVFFPFMNNQFFLNFPTYALAILAVMSTPVIFLTVSGMLPMMSSISLVILLAPIEPSPEETIVIFLVFDIEPATSAATFGNTW